MQNQQLPPVFRFAPSPNGHLHLGHAYSALLNEKMANEAKGHLLLRLENVDRQRSRLEFEAAILSDLDWLGIRFEHKPRRQSDHFDLYQHALESLLQRGLAYGSGISRSEIAALAASDPAWPRDPDGALLAPETERQTQQTTGNYAFRLNMAAALELCSNTIYWNEAGTKVQFDASQWGDVVLKTRDGSFAYHLAVVLDDAAQNVSHIVRGRDLYAATAIHRVLQTVLSLPEPTYHHHDLILDVGGEKLAKSRHSTTLQSLREGGMTPVVLRRQLGFSA